MSIRKDTINLDIRINGENAGKTVRQLTATAKDLKNQMRELDPATKDFQERAAKLKSVNTTLADINASTRAVGRGFSAATTFAGGFIAAFGTDKLAGFITDLGNTAIELESLESKYRTVFGNAVDIVENAAVSQANALGLTSQEYRKAAANIGDLLVPMGFQRTEAANISNELLGLSGALSAWSGGQKSANDVAVILNKALLGEREQMKTLGIAISEAEVSGKLLEKGQKDLTGSALQQAKAMATLELITAKSTDAQARFAGENKTLAQRKAETVARVKELYEQFATNLIPVFEQGIIVVEKIVTFLFSFVNVLIQIPKFIKDNQVAIGALVIAIISLNGVLIKKNAETLIGIARDKLATISTFNLATAKKALNAAMKANPIGFIIAGLALLIGALVTAYQKSETFRGAIAGIGTFAKEFFKIILEGFAAFGKGFSLLKDGQFTDAFKEFGKGLTKLNPVSAALTEGKRLGSAFNKGFKDSLKKSQDDKEAKDLLKKNATIQQQLGAASTGTDITNPALQGSGRASGSADKPEDRTGKSNNFSGNDLISIALKARQEALKASQKVIQEETDKELDIILTAKLKGELTEQEYALRAIDIKKAGKEKELLSLTQFNETETNAYRDKHNELLQLNADFADTSAKQRFDLLTASFTTELSTLEAQYLQGLITEEEYQNARLELKKFYIQQELDLLTANGLSDTEAFRAKELEKLRIQKEIGDLSIAQKKREAQIKQEIESASFGAFNAFVDLAIEASNRETGTRKKNAELIKQFEKARILVNLYAEISGYWKAASGQGPLGIALAVVQSITAGARAALGISKVNSTKFQYGGLLSGPSHTFGGIPISMGGAQVAEAEGGEAFINKRSTAAFRPVLSAINSFNGWGRRFETGGVLGGLSISPNAIAAQAPTSSLQNNTLDRKFEALLDFLGQGLNIRANVVYTDLEATSNTVAQIRAATRS